MLILNTIPESSLNHCPYMAILLLLLLLIIIILIRVQGSRSMHLVFRVLSELT